MNLDKLVRQNILKLSPYSSAREEYQGKDAIFLDANENPYNIPYNRYPDPLHKELKQTLGDKKGIQPDNIFLGNGSDEAIDLLIRTFCEPRRENIMITNPTYGMYAVCAAINDVETKKVSLTPEFQLDVDAIKSSVNKYTKLIFLCSPNNPTGNCFKEEDILEVISFFNGIVVLDEAYIDFTPSRGFIKHLSGHENLVIMQTFSKAYGMAGIRLGMALGKKEIIDLLNKIKYPYNVNAFTQKIALNALKNEKKKTARVNKIMEEKEKLTARLRDFPFVEKIYPSDANFFLVKMTEPKAIYKYLTDQKIIVRDRSDVHLCDNCLRFTVGNKKENNLLIQSLISYSEKSKTG